MPNKGQSPEAQRPKVQMSRGHPANGTHGLHKKFGWALRDVLFIPDCEDRMRISASIHWNLPSHLTSSFCQTRSGYTSIANMLSLHLKFSSLMSNVSFLLLVHSKMPQPNLFQWTELGSCRADPWACPTRLSFWSTWCFSLYCMIQKLLTFLFIAVHVARTSQRVVYTHNSLLDCSLQVHLLIIKFTVIYANL